MPVPIIVDAGPLVALCHPLDVQFRACLAALQTVPVRVPLVTTVATVSEAMYLLAHVGGGRDRLFTALISGRFALESLPLLSLSRLRDLMTRYADLPMDFADATVVELAERLGSETVFTLDERDFRVYQPRHVPHLRLLPADL